MIDLTEDRAAMQALGEERRAALTPREAPTSDAQAPLEHTCGTCPACTAGHWADESRDAAGRRLMTCDRFETIYEPMPTDDNGGSYVRTVYPDGDDWYPGHVWAIVEPPEHHGLIQHVVPVADFAAACELAPVGYVVTTRSHSDGPHATTDRAIWTDLLDLFD
jgi:hypothetical protein